MSTLVVNCRRLPFASTLGVAHVLMNVCRSLAVDHDLVFVVPDLAEFDAGPSASAVRQTATHVLEPDAVSDVAAWRTDAIELLPHHFQPSEFCERSILICHDLHVFDIPWKYGDRAADMQAAFRRNLRSASAVIAHFPRTYYAVEHVARVSLPHLFLSESPLMHDVQAVAPMKLDDGRTRTLLYPAQLQAHKNHALLARVVRRLADRNIDVRVICPGSEFDSSTTESVHEAIRDAGVGHAFEFSGRVSDRELVALYEACDGVVVPSLAEGGAYVALEAIAAGRPVAINAIEAARMHIASVRGDVIWFDADDDEDATEAVAGLLTCDATAWYDRNALSRELIASASWETVAARWNVIIEWLEGCRPRPIVRVDRCASQLTYV